MSPGLYARYMWRESRGSAGRLLFFVACLAVGVAAVVAVAGLSSSLDEGLRVKARELLAADVRVKSRRPIPAELGVVLASLPGVRRGDVRELVSVVAAADGATEGRSHLAELKVVDDSYPFYGTLELEPARPLAELLGPDRVVVAPALAASLELGHGATLRIGGVDFTVTGTVLKEPDGLEVTFTSIAPRIFLSPEGLARTGLETRGSRIDHRALIRLPDGSDARDADAVAQRIREALPDAVYIEVETYAEAQPALRRGLNRAGRFLGLVALLSLLIGGIGVAETVRSWLAGRMDAIAVLKCLGLRPREVVALYLGQTALLGLAGSLVGALAGMAVQRLLPPLLEGLLPIDLIRPWQPEALLRGLVLGVGVSVLFCLPPLLALRTVPPARVLRRDAEPLRAGRGVRWASWTILPAGVLLAAWIQSESLPLAAGFTAGLVALVLVLTLAAVAVSRAVARVPRGVTRVWLRHGLAGLARPGAGTLGAILALGVGVVLVLTMYLVEERLGREFEAELPDDAPTAFLVDIQPDQWPDVERLLREAGATRIDSVPLINARLAAVDGTPVAELVGDGAGRSRRKWVLTREQRLTYLPELPQGNRIVAGALWDDPAAAEVSIEQDFAADLGVTVGSGLRLDVQGVPVELTVTSIRTVDWKTFGINFFLIVEPGVLDEAPQYRVAAARLPSGDEQALADRLAASFPNVTMIPIREVLDRVVAILRQAGLGVRLLGAFTVVAGVLILGGAISAGSVRRGREVALLKTLGMTRWGVLSVFSVEYALIGLVAGAIGGAGGAAVAWFVTTRWLLLDFEATPSAWAVAVAGSVLLAVVAGLAASLGALARRPLEVLRAD